ncbi:transposase [Alcanivorax sp. JB21]|uniref:REP-associated tyrosine transposase n=1 Tax=Alcanivorax limicola TaxID=2874102 RepID=UPI001CC09F5C|nr:transposase [Alcanivorax limicola]MBZ2188115.1 transposase [Alcanivorax limicola]
MPNYRRPWRPGATWFFTVTCQHRYLDPPLIKHIDALRDSIQRVRMRHPFHIDAMVVLPDHLHAIWTLPPNDVDFATRWSLIKAGFSRRVPDQVRRSPSQHRRRERSIWQRRFWEHLIRDERDYQRHMDYIHFNPVKHGLAPRAVDWPFSSFHRAVRQGLYSPDWAASPDDDLQAGE